eukprot:TRINITY_DN4263_c0_g1_i11.p1 TRINITY_DN4263_c0_g1~~TRINITY_DN4263_c0_g1_i11.p1  ORF type:complete len:1031 (+),score=106.82 TRINITY_DN4263_c0_g1_i11:519-3611(+)
MLAWTYQGFTCSDYCCNPDSYAGGAWCFVVDPASCQGTTWGVCLAIPTTTPTTTSNTLSSSLTATRRTETATITITSTTSSSAHPTASGTSTSTSTVSSTPTSTFTGTSTHSMPTSRSTSSTRSETTTATTIAVAAHGRSTDSGCPCMVAWTYQGYTCSDYCCNPDSYAGGAWCLVVDPASCQGTSWDVCRSILSTTPTTTTSDTLSFTATSFTATRRTASQTFMTATTTSSISASSIAFESSTMTSIVRSTLTNTLTATSSSSTGTSYSSTLTVATTTSNSTRSVTLEASTVTSTVTGTLSSTLIGASSSSTLTLRSTSLTTSETSATISKVVARGRNTQSGCPCMSTWTYQGYTCSEYCCNPDSHAGGAWCFVVDPASCQGATWGVCHTLLITTTTATSNTLSSTTASFTVSRWSTNLTTPIATAISGSASSTTTKLITVTSTVASTPTSALTGTSNSSTLILGSTSLSMSKTSAMSGAEINTSTDASISVFNSTLTMTPPAVSSTMTRTSSITSTTTYTSVYPSTVTPRTSTASTTTGTSTGMLSITGDMYLLVDDASAFASSLRLDSGAMNALRAGVAAPFQGLTSAMVMIRSVTSSRRLTKSRLLAGTVTVEYQLNYPAGIGLTWEELSQAPDQISAAINGNFRQASISLAVTGVTLAERHPTTTQTQTRQPSISETTTHTTTGTLTSLTKNTSQIITSQPASITRPISSTPSATHRQTSHSSPSTAGMTMPEISASVSRVSSSATIMVMSETGTLSTTTCAPSASPIAALNVNLKSAQSISPSNTASSALLSTTLLTTSQPTIAPAILEAKSTFPSALAVISLISFMFLITFLCCSRLWYKRRCLNEKNCDELGLDDLALAPAEASLEAPAEDDAKKTKELDDASSASRLHDSNISALQDVMCILIRDECQSTDLDEQAAKFTDSTDESNSNMQCSPLADDSFDQISTSFLAASGDADQCLSPRTFPTESLHLPAPPPASSLKSGKRKGGKIAQAGAGRRRRSKKDRQKAAAGTSKDTPPRLPT